MKRSVCTARRAGQHKRALMHRACEWVKAGTQPQRTGGRWEEGRLEAAWVSPAAPLLRTLNKVLHERLDVQAGGLGSGQPVGKECGGELGVSTRWKVAERLQ